MATYLLTYIFHIFLSLHNLFRFLHSFSTFASYPLLSHSPFCYSSNPVLSRVPYMYIAMMSRGSYCFSLHVILRRQETSSNKKIKIKHSSGAILEIVLSYHSAADRMVPRIPSYDAESHANGDYITRKPSCR